MADLAITQTADLSLTENLVPAIVHVKQYDNGSRAITCSVYLDSVQFDVPDDAVVNVTGTRPDGNIFQYSSDTDTDVVYAADGVVSIVVTEYMTADAGRVPVDITLLDDSDVSLGPFSFVLQVERAAVENEGLTLASYSKLLSSIAESIIDCYIDDDGNFCIVTDDALGLTFSMDDTGTVSVDY